jgi:hypothetical protein
MVGGLADDGLDHGRRRNPRRHVIDDLVAQASLVAFEAEM